MIRTILVPVCGDATDDGAYRCALVAGRLFGAHLDFFLVRADPILTSVVPSAGGPAFAEAIADLQKDDQERAERARDLFQTICAREGLDVNEKPTGSQGVSAAWHEEKGDEASLVTWRARFSDLVITSRPGKHQGRSRQTIEAALMASGRPILLAAAERTASLTGTIVIAWKDTAEAARAVTAAMPFLARSGRVVIMTVSDAAEQGTASAQILAEQLRWHRLEVEARFVRPGREPGARALVSAAREVNAELVVMGGYGHSRLREFVFGGFTRSMLEAFDLPTLMLH